MDACRDFWCQNNLRILAAVWISSWSLEDMFFLVAHTKSRLYLAEGCQVFLRLRGFWRNQNLMRISKHLPTSAISCLSVLLNGSRRELASEICEPEMFWGTECHIILSSSTFYHNLMISKFRSHKLSIWRIYLWPHGLRIVLLNLRLNPSQKN